MTDAMMAAPSCSCITCATCHGRGWFYVDGRGRFMPYGDELADRESCEDCGGSGITELCDACREGWEDEDGDGL